jgi:hypothetical protein
MLSTAIKTADMYKRSQARVVGRVCRYRKSDRRASAGLELVPQGEHRVERMAAWTGLSIANTSRHLLHLRRSAEREYQALVGRLPGVAE